MAPSLPAPASPATDGRTPRGQEPSRRIGLGGRLGGKLRQGVSWPGLGPPTRELLRAQGHHPLPPSRHEQPRPQQSSPGHRQGKRDESHQAQSHAGETDETSWEQCGAMAPTAPQSSGKRTWDVSQLEWVGSPRNVRETMGGVRQDHEVSPKQGQATPASRQGHTITERTCPRGPFGSCPSAGLGHRMCCPKSQSHAAIRSLTPRRSQPALIGSLA